MRSIRASWSALLHWNCTRRAQAIVNHALFRAYRTTDRDLAIYRILFAAYLLLTYVPHALRVGHWPQAFFNPPPGAPSLLAGFPSPWAVWSVNGLFLFAVAALLAGWHTRLASLGTALALCTLNTWYYSTGKINHDILLIAIPAVLAWSTWGRALSLDATRGDVTTTRARLRNGAPVAFAVLIIALAMLTAGLIKIYSGWLSLDASAVFSHLAPYRYAFGRDTMASEWLVLYLPAPLWEIADWATVALECGFILCAPSRVAMRIILATACFFHLGVWLTFDITFTNNIVAYAVLVPWATLADRAKPWLARLDVNVAASPGTYAMFLGTALAVGLNSLFILKQPLADSALFPLRQTILLLAMGVACSHLFAVSRHLWRRYGRARRECGRAAG